MHGFPPKRIVVGFDPSPASRAAADAAKALARRWGSSVELVYVRQPVLVAAGLGPEAMPLPVPAPDPAFEAMAQRRLSEAASGSPAGRISALTVEGWPSRAILERAAAGGAGLIVMGTHGYAGLDRALLGSIAEAVVRGSSVPVLTVRASSPPMKAPLILVPWNGRPYATRALRYACLTAKSLGAGLHVLHVAADRLSVDEADAELEKRLEAVIGARGAPAWTLRVRYGDARRHIVDEANSGRYGLVALSAHRRPFSSDVVLGSTVERLLRHCRVPVLSVPSGRRAMMRRSTRTPSRAGARAAGSLIRS